MDVSDLMIAIDGFTIIPTEATTRLYDAADVGAAMDPMCCEPTHGMRRGVLRAVGPGDGVLELPLYGRLVKVVVTKHMLRDLIQTCAQRTEARATFRL